MRSSHFTHEYAELESYLSRSLALALLTLAVINLVLTGTIPLTNTTSGPDTDEKPAYAYPVVIIVTTYHALTSFYIYTQYSWTGSISFLLGLIGSVGLFCMGTWVILFGSEQGKVSKTTGADKRTSNFPFKNEESAREKKKASRKRL